MADAIQYLKLLPDYVLDLIHLASSPKVFLASRNRGVEKDWLRALTFFVVSAGLSVGMLAMAGPAIEFGHFLPRAVVAWGLQVILVGLAIKSSWALLGGHATYISTLLTLFYITGFALITVNFFTLAAFSVCAIFDTELYNEMIARDKKFTSDPGSIWTMIPPLSIGDIQQQGAFPRGFVAGLVGMIMFGGSVAAATWILVTWGSFRQLNAGSRLRSLTALLLTALCGILISALLAVILRFGQALR